MKTKKLLFILNPRAGRNKPHGPLFDALAILSGAGYLIRIHETSAPGDAADTAAREGAGYDLVVAAGGDGTLNEVISGLMRPPGNHQRLRLQPPDSTDPGVRREKHCTEPHAGTGHRPVE